MVGPEGFALISRTFSLQSNLDVDVRMAYLRTYIRALCIYLHRYLHGIPLVLGAIAHA